MDYSDNELIDQLNRYCKLQVKAMCNPNTGALATSITVLFNGLSYNSPKLIRTVADRLGIEHDLNKNPHALLEKIADVASKKSLGDVSGIATLSSLKKRINQEYEALNTKPTNPVSATLCEMRIAKQIGG